MKPRTRTVWALVAAAAALAAFLFWRHLRPEHAVVLAIAIGALLYTTLRTVERLGSLYRRK
jgi:hypothetical protein